MQTNYKADYKKTGFTTKVAKVTAKFDHLHNYIDSTSLFIKNGNCQVPYANFYCKYKY